MRLILLAGLLFVSIQATGQEPLASLRDRNRVLLVFAPNGQDERLRAQLARLDGKQMAERDLILIRVLATWDKLDDVVGIAHAPFSTPGEQAAIRRRFHIHSNDFTVILIGKDGGEKFRSHNPVPIEKLIQLIDSMPMRQQEMKSRN